MERCYVADNNRTAEVYSWMLWLLIIFTIVYYFVQVSGFRNEYLTYRGAFIKLIATGTTILLEPLKE